MKTCLPLTGPKSVFITMVLAVAVPAVIAQQSNFRADEAKLVLSAIKDDIKKNYYDPKFHGIDLDARFKTAEEKLKTATSPGQLMAIIAQVLLDFDDSHLFFVPPARASSTEYGWDLQAVGDKVFVSAVKPGSDGEAKALKEGDRVLSISGYQPTRDNLWVINYLFRALRPQPGVRFALEDPDGKQRQLDVMAKVKQGKQIMDLTSSIDFMDYFRQLEAEDRLDRSRWADFGDDLLIWKLPTFAVGDSAIDPMIARTKKYKTVILDLRGNSGGYVTTCEKMIGSFFDKDVAIAEYRGRKEVKPMKSRRSSNYFAGKLIVLVDSRSASASEIFARVIQLEKRGTVIGDRSAGAVMRATYLPHRIGISTIIPFGASVTDADVIMSDGKSLEKVGVIPDELILPTAADIAAKRDPVLAHAAQVAGVQLDPEKAGALFPMEWRK